jgi:hypothetical protein
MKKLNDLINNLETYKELTTVPRDTLIKELKECKDELTEQLRLHSVSQHRELLKSCFLALDEVSRDNAIITDEDAFIDEVIKDFNCG